MRKIASLLLIALAMGATYLFVQNQVPVQTLPKSVSSSVILKQLAYREPIVLSRKELAEPLAPVVTEEKTEKQPPRFQVFAEAIPLRADMPLETLRCAAFYRISETQLPRMKEFLERHSLVERMLIEPLSELERYALYLGPFERASAEAEVLKLKKKGVENPSVSELRQGGYAVVIRTFRDSKEAEFWSTENTPKLGLKKLKISRFSEVADPKINIVFNGLTTEQLTALLKRSNKTGLMLYRCLNAE